MEEEFEILDIGTRLLDNTAVVRIHVVERFSKDFSEVRGLRSRELKLYVELDHNSAVRGIMK